MDFYLYSGYWRNYYKTMVYIYSKDMQIILSDHTPSKFLADF